MLLRKRQLTLSRVSVAVRYMQRGQMSIPSYCKADLIDATSCTRKWPKEKLQLQANFGNQVMNSNLCGQGQNASCWYLVVI